MSQSNAFPISSDPALISAYALWVRQQSIAARGRVLARKMGKRWAIGEPAALSWANPPAEPESSSPAFDAEIRRRVELVDRIRKDILRIGRLQRQYEGARIRSRASGLARSSRRDAALIAAGIQEQIDRLEVAIFSRIAEVAK